MPRTSGSTEIREPEDDEPVVAADDEAQGLLVQCASASEIQDTHIDVNRGQW